MQCGIIMTAEHTGQLVKEWETEYEDINKGLKTCEVQLPGGYSLLSTK
jgi:hypothetical protein